MYCQILNRIHNTGSVSACPSLLFPYARQIVSDAVRDGGFPPLYLNMVDFASIYQQQQAQKAGGGTMV